MATEFCMECNQKLGSWSARFGGNNTIFCNKCFKNEEVVQRHVNLNAVKNSAHEGKPDLPFNKSQTANKLIQEEIHEISDELVLFYQLSTFVKSERFEFWFLLILHLVLLVIANHEWGYNPGRYGSQKEWVFSSDIGHSIKVILSYFFFTKLSQIARK